MFIGVFNTKEVINNEKNNRTYVIAFLCSNFICTKN